MTTTTRRPSWSGPMGAISPCTPSITRRNSRTGGCPSGRTTPPTGSRSVSLIGGGTWRPYWRVSIRPHDATDWQPERQFDWRGHLAAADAADNVTYSNVFYLSAEGRVYDFVRAVNRDPSILVSTDQGDNWSYGGKLLTEPRLGYVNGYTKYVSNGIDRVDFITTEHHPRDFNNSVYHGYVRNGKLHRSDGTVVHGDVFDGGGVPQTELTKVFSAGSVWNGETMTHTWTMDLHVDRSGRPVGLISCRANDEPGNTNYGDHRFFYARYDGLG